MRMMDFNRRKSIKDWLKQNKMTNMVRMPMNQKDRKVTLTEYRIS